MSDPRCTNGVKGHHVHEAIGKTYIIRKHDHTSCTAQHKNDPADTCALPALSEYEFMSAHSVEACLPDYRHIINLWHEL